MESYCKQEEIDLASKALYPGTRLYHSLLKKYFPKDLCLKLHKLTMAMSTDNNTKANYIEKYLKEFNVPATILGSGTNRIGIKIEGYCFKIAFDKAGCIDNKREFIYSKNLQPYVVKTYECFPTGLVSVCEYVRGFESSDIRSSEVAYNNRKKMKKILDIISENFLVGDVGISDKNYGNWGIRVDGSICILDYAYIYSINYKQMECSCGGKLYYDDNYIKLNCCECGKSYNFGQLRKKITREDEAREIGDITKKGYTLKLDIEEKELNPKFIINGMDNVDSYIEKQHKKAEKEYYRSDKKDEDLIIFETDDIDDVITNYVESRK